MPFITKNIRTSAYDMGHVIWCIWYGPYNTCHLLYNLSRPKHMIWSIRYGLYDIVHLIWVINYNNIQTSVVKRYPSALNVSVSWSVANRSFSFSWSFITFGWTMSSDNWTFLNIGGKFKFEKCLTTDSGLVRSHWTMPKNSSSIIASKISSSLISDFRWRNLLV